MAKLLASSRTAPAWAACSPANPRFQRRSPPSLAGVIPVVNDAANHRLVSDNPFIAYTEPSPQALADRLLGVLDRADQPEYAERAAASVGETDWATAGVQFLEAFQAGLHG